MKFSFNPMRRFVVLALGLSAAALLAHAQDASKGLVIYNHPFQGVCEESIVIF